MKQIKLLAICSLAIFAACTSSNKMKKMDGMDDMNKTVMVGGAEINTGF